MDNLKIVVNGLMQELISKSAVLTDKNPQVWLKNILTKRELGHIKFKYFKKGILGVNVDSSSWIYKLNLRKQELLSGSCKEVKEIRFYLGEVK